MMQPFEYERPKTLEAAAQAVQNGALPLAGGTDIVPLLKCEVRTPKALVDLGSVESLSTVAKGEGCYAIGAMARLAQLGAHPELEELFPALTEAARAVASPQIRAMGTIGGNVMQDRRCLYFNQSWEWRQSFAPCFKTGGTVCHQAPVSPECRAPYYSDVATALCAYGALAEVLENGKHAQMSVSKLCAQHGECNGTSTQDGLLVTGFTLPIRQNMRSVFIKESVRASIDFPTFNAAGCAWEENGALVLRLVVGAVGKAPVELTKTQAMVQSAAELKERTAELKESALAEIGEHAVLVREAAVSIKVKRSAFRGIFRVLDALARQL